MRLDLPGFFLGETGHHLHDIGIEIPQALEFLIVLYLVQRHTGDQFFTLLGLAPDSADIRQQTTLFQKNAPQHLIEPCHLQLLSGTVEFILYALRRLNGKLILSGRSLQVCRHPGQTLRQGSILFCQFLDKGVLARHFGHGHLGLGLGLFGLAASFSSYQVFQQPDPLIHSVEAAFHPLLLNLQESDTHGLAQ